MSGAARWFQGASFVLFSVVLNASAQAQTITLSGKDADLLKLPYDESFPSLAPCFSKRADTDAIAASLGELGWTKIAKEQINPGLVAPLGWENYVSGLNVAPTGRFPLNREQLFNGVRAAHSASKAPDTERQQSRLFSHQKGALLMLVNRAADAIVLCKMAYSVPPTGPLMPLTDRIRKTGYPRAPQVHTLELPNQSLGNITKFARITHLSRDAWHESAPDLAIPTAFVSAGRALNTESK